jgi:hypothetical protein
MTVRRTQNSGIPAQQPAAEIQDGTSNTIIFANTARGEAPFAKDSFETPKEFFRSTSGLKEDTEVTDKSRGGTANGLKAGASEVLMESFADRGESKGLKVQDATGFMDYTDDALIKKRD